MKLYFLIFTSFALITVIVTGWAQQKNPQQTINGLKVMTYNIRYDNPGDSLSQWKYRKDMVASMITFYEADILGVQEALPNQIQDLEKALPGFAWYGVGREDGKNKGEFSAVFYNKNKFRVLDKGTFWLSETPSTPSKSWDSSLPRIVSWVKLKHNATGKEFYHVNTHYDHRGTTARKESSKLLLSKVTDFAKGNPVIVTGDFNCTEDSEPYAILAASNVLKDAIKESANGHHGPDGTFCGFDVCGKIGSRIDYIFVTSGIKVLRHGTLSDSRNGKYPSDHFPVLAEVSL